MDGRRLFRILIVTLGISNALFAQKEPAAPPKMSQKSPAAPSEIPRMTLKKVGSVEASLEGSGFYGSPLCDSEGNIYLRTDASLRLDQNPVWKISPRGRKIEVFAPPVESSKEFRLGEFTVSGSGDFYAVTYDYNEETENYVLLHYGSDGEISSKTHLQLPEQFHVDKLAVFASGSILVSGHFSSKAMESLRDQPRLLFLQSDGTPGVQLQLTGKAAAKVEGNLSQNSISMGDDGNAYLLRGPEVLVISPSGRLERTIPLSIPASGFDAERVEISKGVLSVTFSRIKPGTKGTVEVMFRTYDPVTGVVQAEYVPDSGLVYSLCFDPNEGYTFLGQNDGKTELVRAWVR